VPSERNSGENLENVVANGRIVLPSVGSNLYGLWPKSHFMLRQAQHERESQKISTHHRSR
jgi:hypothetical protein